MSSLDTSDRKNLERLFVMSGGYVLDFKSSEFDDFIMESVKIDANDDKYVTKGTSKAKRLRSIWKHENDYIVGKLTQDMMKYRSNTYERPAYEEEVPERVIELCERIANRLINNSVGADTDAITILEDSRDNELLVSSIKNDVLKGKPELAIDRLHTYMIRFVRLLCANHEIEYNQKETLNSLFGKYIKGIKKKGYINRAISERILKYAISILDSFNHIRNNESLAHDNDILISTEDSMLIIETCNSLIRYVNKVENTNSNNNATDREESDDGLPF